MQVSSLVYKTTNRINNKFYIGVHTTDSINDDYLGSGVLIKQAIKKYGRDCFDKEIIQVFDNKEDAYKLESEIVNKSLVANRKCYNITEGGGDPPTFEGVDHPRSIFDAKDRREIIGLYKKGNSTSVIAKKYNTSKPAICYLLEKLGVERDNTYEFPKGKDHQNWIDKDVDAIIDMYKSGLSCCAIGRKMGLYPNVVNRALRLSGIEIRVISKNRNTPVRQIDKNGNTVAIFDTLKDASTYTGLNNTNISLACRGKRKTAGGYTWRYENAGK